MTPDLAAKIAKEWARIEARRKAGFYPAVSDRLFFQQNPKCKCLIRPAQHEDSPRFLFGLADPNDYETHVYRGSRRHIVWERE